MNEFRSSNLKLNHLVVGGAIRLKNRNGAQGAVLLGRSKSDEANDAVFDMESRVIVMDVIRLTKRWWAWTILAIVTLWISYKIFLALWFFGTIQSPPVKDTPVKEKIHLSDFSPDGNKLYLDYCDTTRHCNIGQFDLQTQEASLFVPQDTQDAVASPSSSDDGKQLVVVIKEAAGNYETSQIGILDLATHTYRAVTQSQTFKEWPSFSHDGKKIIYAQSNRKRTSGKTRFSEWDIYEMELATGVERRLTNFCFFVIDRPQYMVDNKRFVFSGDPTCNFPNQGSADSYKAYQKQYQDNTVFVMSGDETTLKPLVISGDLSHGATLTRDGLKILFKAITNKMDNSKEFSYNFDLFTYEEGKIHRLTNLKTYLSDYAISAHGEWVAYLSDEQRNNNDVFWIMDVAAGTHSKINLGEHNSFTVTNIINQPKGEQK